MVGDPVFAGRSSDDARWIGDFWRKIRAAAARIPFAEDAVAAYYCALDYETPVRVRAAIFGALAYFVLPADAVPDMLPGVGFADDAAVLTATLQLVAAHVQEVHREAARRALAALTAKHTKF
jgi:uncharacterized membrane protein YkvA (DUF1232 family)